VFGVFAGEDMVGLTAIIAEADRKTAQLVASYIREAHRGLGLSTMLYRARLEWFRERPEFEKLLVSHRASNDASRRAIQKFGFRMTGVIAGKVWPDGTIDDQIDHELTRAEIAAILRNITK
jgi:RimJ/RimL family protein N-acetyltransferase